MTYKMYEVIDSVRLNKCLQYDTFVFDTVGHIRQIHHDICRYHELKCRSLDVLCLLHDLFSLGPQIARINSWPRLNKALRLTRVYHLYNSLPDFMFRWSDTNLWTLGDCLALHLWSLMSELGREALSRFVFT